MKSSASDWRKTGSHRFDTYTARYFNGEWRAYIFRDMILDEAKRLRLNSRPGRRLTFLDIGCGNGFDGAPRVQGMITPAADFYWGVEPDTAMDVGDRFDRIWRTEFESADIPKESVDVAFAVMVVEHLAEPQPFLDRLAEVLKPDGVAWVFTVDRRHSFVMMSRLAQILGLKRLYLRLLNHESEGLRTHKCYRTWYRFNDPRAIARLTGTVLAAGSSLACSSSTDAPSSGSSSGHQSWSSVDVINFRKVGQMDYYLPSFLQPVGRLLDRISIFFNRPGSILAVRLTRSESIQPQ